jgi:hypothetical protein
VVLGPGAIAAGLAMASAGLALAAGWLIMWRRHAVAEPNYLETGYFLALVPLLSPHGWDYVLVIALPAYVCKIDRWRDLSSAWRVVALVGVFLTSFTIFDLLGRRLYTRLMDLSAVSVGGRADRRMPRSTASTRGRMSPRALREYRRGLWAALVQPTSAAR